MFLCIQNIPNILTCGHCVVCISLFYWTAVFHRDIFERWEDLNSIISSITSWCVVHYDYINMSCSTSRIVISNITTSIPIGPICGVKGNCQERLVYISDPLDTSATVYIQCSINPCRTCTEFVFRNTARCRYNAVNFLQNSHKRHPIARPLGRGMRCLLCVQTLVRILSQ